MDASAFSHEHPSTGEFYTSKISKSSHGAMHGNTSLLSSNKQENIFQYDDILGMETSSCDSTAVKPLQINCNETFFWSSNCNEILSSPFQYHPRPHSCEKKISKTKEGFNTVGLAQKFIVMSEA